MKQGNKFTNKSFAVQGTWYEPLNVMRNGYKSIVYGEYMDTTSSAGDWGGYIVQKLGESYYGIPFVQENLHHEIGFFSVTTMDVVAKAKSLRECQSEMEDWFKEQYNPC